MKHEWVMDFADQVWGHAIDTGQKMDNDLAYQLGCAYFDWNDEGTDALETVQEAFDRYVLFDTAIKKSFSGEK